jgi:iron complex transport system substrate-binding protein
MRADLVILASFNKPAVIDHVKRRKIRHILLKDFDSLADVKRNIIKVATVVGQRKRGRELVRDFSAAITELSRPVSDKSPRVLSIDPGFMTMGKETLLHDLIETAGGKNQAALWGISRWQKISQEKILAEDPDLIIVGYKTADPAKETDWLHRSALGGLRKPNLKRRICMVPSNSLLSTSHHILSALKKISSCVNLWKK